MPEFLISFDQRWVGDHTEEWFHSRGPLARTVVREMEAAGVVVFAGGLEEDLADAFVADATSGALEFRYGPHVDRIDFMGGMTIVDVPDEATARMWAGRIAEACGWPQEVRRFKPRLDRS